MKRDVVFSRDKQYRYLLSRVWEEHLPIVTFVGLNPSVADDVDDDPTTKRCMDFAKRWGFGGVKLVNLFAHVSTDRKALRTTLDPIGPENDDYLISSYKNSDIIVAAWGNDGKLLSRARMVRKHIPVMLCLDINKSGEPKHPLYVKSGALPYLYCDR